MAGRSARHRGAAQVERTAPGANGTPVPPRWSARYPERTAPPGANGTPVPPRWSARYPERTAPRWRRGAAHGTGTGEARGTAKANGTPR